jgi:DNA primase
VRPIRRAPVSAPLRWDEIEGLGRPDAFTIANLPDRLATVGDLLAPALKLAQKLPAKTFTAGETKAAAPRGGRAAAPATKKH